jgi:STE24 endopeptidase
MFYLFSIFMTRPEASAALGGTSPTLELNLLAFMLVYGPVSMLAGLATSYLSRKHEYEADSFAAKTYNGAALISALKKLSTKNLSNPDPHPLNVFFYYSHPTVTQRISAIEKVNRID